MVTLLSSLRDIYYFPDGHVANRVIVSKKRTQTWLIFSLIIHNILTHYYEPFNIKTFKKENMADMVPTAWTGCKNCLKQQGW